MKLFLKKGQELCHSLRRKGIQPMITKETKPDRPGEEK
jgi:hypothetical protein